MTLAKSADLCHNRDIARFPGLHGHRPRHQSGDACQYGGFGQMDSQCSYMMGVREQVVDFAVHLFDGLLIPGAALNGRVEDLHATRKLVARLDGVAVQACQARKREWIRSRRELPDPHVLMPVLAEVFGRDVP